MFTVMCRYIYNDHHYVEVKTAYNPGGNKLYLAVHAMLRMRCTFRMECVIFRKGTTQQEQVTYVCMHIQNRRHRGVLPAVNMHFI
jgi:hypothetical protein